MPKASRFSRCKTKCDIQESLFKITIENNATFDWRFYGFPAQPREKYLFPTFTNQTNWVGLAGIKSVTLSKLLNISNHGNSDRTRH